MPKTELRSGMSRMHLEIPVSIRTEAEALAKAEGNTVTEVIRKSLKLYLYLKRNNIDHLQPSENRIIIL